MGGIHISAISCQISAIDKLPDFRKQILKLPNFRIIFPDFRTSTQPLEMVRQHQQEMGRELQQEMVRQEMHFFVKTGNGSTLFLLTGNGSTLFFCSLEMVRHFFYAHWKWFDTFF
jgi:hypothetical protein